MCPVSLQLIPRKPSSRSKGRTRCSSTSVLTGASFTRENYDLRGVGPLHCRELLSRRARRGLLHYVLSVAGIRRSGLPPRCETCVDLPPPLPVLAPLGQPARSYLLFTSFHWTSPLAWAGPILLAFLLAVLLNGRFFFYPDVVLAYRTAHGFRKKALRVLMINKPPTGALPTTSALWLKLTGALAFILALFFGYPGLELGILGSRPLWANPANPLMFLLTGVISGMAFSILLWTLLGRREAAGPAGTGAGGSTATPTVET